MKIGVVGLGFMGSTHLEAYQSVEGAEIVAVASDDPKKLAGDLSGVGGNLDRGGGKIDFSNAARYPTAEELIADPNVEAVDLCTPSFLHASQAEAALEAGRHVLVEKPMALNNEDCDRMLAAQEKSGKVLMVAQVLRFWPDWAAMREKIRSGELGAVKHAFFHRRCAAPAWSAWLADRSRSGGGVVDLLIHDLDFCRHLFGMPESVEARGVENLEAGIDVVEAKLEYPDGPLVTVAGGWRHPKGYPFTSEFTVVLEGGTLDFHTGLRELTLYDAEGETIEVEKPEQDAFQAELAVFIEACRKGEAPADCPPSESADAVRLALAMRESRDQGGAPVTF